MRPRLQQFLEGRPALQMQMIVLVLGLSNCQMFRLQTPAMNMANHDRASQTLS